MRDSRTTVLLTLILALDIGCQLHAPVSLLSEKVPETHRIGDWVGPHDREWKYGEGNIPSFCWESNILDRSARNKFTTVTELSRFTSAMETMQVNFYKTGDFCLCRKMWFWVLKYVRCEDCHHPKKWGNWFLSSISKLPQDYSASYPMRQTVLILKMCRRTLNDSEDGYIIISVTEILDTAHRLSIKCTTFQKLYLPLSSKYNE
jgi:hypothetical protein